MRMDRYYIIILLLILTIISNGFAQDNTQAGLPEGAIARLGKGGINLMRFSPDGARLVVGTDVGVWLYDLPDGKETSLFTGQRGQVNAIAFSPDGKTLASSGEDSPVIQFWNLDTEEKHHAIGLTTIRDSVVMLAFHGTTLISLDRRGQIIYWNADTGKELSETGKIMQFNAVALSKDNNHFAIGTQDGKIHLWDATTGKRKKALIGHASLFKKQDKEVIALAFSPDGKILASGSEDKTVQLWNTQDFNKITTLRGHKGWITSIAFSQDGKTLATGDASKVIKLWDIKTKKVKGTLSGHKNTINALAFAPESMSQYSGCLASGSADGTIRFWNPETEEELIPSITGHTEWVKEIAFSENDTTLYSAVFNGTVEIWDLSTYQVLDTFISGHSDSTWSVALSSDAKFFASRGGDAMIVFNSLGSGAHISGGGGSNLKIWEISSGKEFPVQMKQRGIIQASPAFFPDNNLVAVSDFRTIRVWHINTGTVLFQLNTKSPMHRGKMVFSPDGKKFAVVSSGRVPEVWDVATQNNITPPNMKPAEAFSFSPNGATVATASSHGIHLWKLDAAENVHTPLDVKLFGLDKLITFSPDGTFLVGTDGRKLKLIDVETGNEFSFHTTHSESIETLVFSHDGKTLASASADGTVLLWDWEQISAK